MEELYLQLRYRFESESDVINAVGLTMLRKVLPFAIGAAALFVYSAAARFVPLPYFSFHYDIYIFATFAALLFVAPFGLAAAMMPSVKAAACENDSILSLYETYYTEQSIQGTLRYNYANIDRVTLSDRCLTIHAGKYNSFIPRAAFALNNVRLSHILAYMQSKGANIPVSLIEKADKTYY